MGLLFQSIEKCGSISSFEKKYVFSYDCLEKDLRPFIEKNIQESLRKAENELNGSTGIDLWCSYGIISSRVVAWTSYIRFNRCCFNCYSFGFGLLAIY